MALTRLQKTMLAALESSLGVVTVAAKAANIHRDSHYTWLKKSEEYREAVKKLDDVAIDFVESQLYKKIKAGNTACIIFYLKTKARDRGYIERHEVTGQDGAPLRIIIEDVDKD